MATLDAAAIELATSLHVDEVPAKLRCGSCNKLAINAVKLPCCDQTICEPCSQDLPDTCPICSHSPLSSDDLKPNKSLRTTIKAFLKIEEKKRSKNIETHAPESLPTPTLGAAPVESAEVALETSVEASAGSPGTAGRIIPTFEDGENHTAQTPTNMEDTQDSEKNIQNTLEAADGNQEDEDDDDEDDVVITTERPEHEIEQQTYSAVNEPEEQADEPEEKEQANGQNLGFDQSQNFGNMDFSNMNNLNPMMAMQNGMGMPNFMGMPNMMGMPGMNMDPSMMFGGGFGMGGMNDMGMNMMGMGMGMNGMGSFGGMPGMGNMGSGPGFFPPNGGGGYNNQQQNFGSHMNQNFNHNRGYGRPYNRGFGRGGRGNSYGRGRGGWQNYGQFDRGPNQNQSFMSPQLQQQQNFRGNDEHFGAGAQQGATRGSPSYEPMKAPEGSASDDAQQSNVTDAERTGDTNDADVHTNGQNERATADVNGDIKDESGVHDANDDPSNDTPKHVDSTDPAADRPGDHDFQSGKIDADQAIIQNETNFTQQNSAAHARAGSFGTRGGFRGRSGAYGTFSTPAESEATPVAAPINAPTGPKAMRQGLPNSGWYSRPQQQQAQPPAAARPPSSRGRDGEADSESQARHRSRSRSASRDRQRTERRRSRHDLEEESEDSHERRKERERRKRKEREARYEEERNGDESSEKNHSRSASKSGDRSKRRHRDKEDEHRSSRRDKSRERRKHRHRSRSPERDSSMNGDSHDSSRRKHKSERRPREDREESERAKEKSSRRSRREYDGEEGNKDHSNGSSRHRKYSRDDRERDFDNDKLQSAVVVEEPEEEFEFKIKGKSAASMKQSLDTSMGPPASLARGHSERRSSVQASTPVTPSTPSVDPYAAERESHRKQREAEQQKKMEGRRSSQGLGKRSHGEDDSEVPTGPRGESGRNGKRARKDMRKHSLKYEGEVGDGYEERDARSWR